MYIVNCKCNDIMLFLYDGSSYEMSLNVLKQFCDKMWKCRQESTLKKKDIQETSRCFKNKISIISNLLNFIKYSNQLIFNTDFLNAKINSKDVIIIYYDNVHCTKKIKIWLKQALHIFEYFEKQNTMQLHFYQKFAFVSLPGIDQTSRANVSLN